jgi:hypothetical protein
MNFATISTEVQARGFDYLSSTRLGYFVNEAYHELCDSEDWPFLITTATAQSGSSTVSLADLRSIESVFDTANKANVKPIDRRDLTEITTDLTTVGVPQWYYMLSDTTFKVYPVGGTLTVNYYKAATDLTGTDTPIIPTRWHRLIVDGACLRASKDADDYPDRTALQQAYDRDLTLMRATILNKNHDEPKFISSQRGHEGY